LELEQTTPAAPSKEGDHFFDARPPLLGQGGEFSHSQQMSKLQGEIYDRPISRD
jgi:hypothetical protein